MEDKMYLFLISWKEQSGMNMVPLQSDVDCWAYIRQHKERWIEVPYNTPTVDWGYSWKPMFIHDNKLYNPTRSLMCPEEHYVLIVCYESTNDSDVADADYPALYTDKEPVTRFV